jgi:hypothetical protein
MKNMENQRNLFEEESFSGNLSISEDGSMLQICSICFWKFHDY